MDNNGVTGNGRGGSDELTVSIVIYHGAMDLLDKTIVSLRDAIRTACAAGLINRASLIVVDNRERVDPGGEVEDMLKRIQPCAYRIIRPGGNPGFGQGHNLAIAAGDASYHLLLNPDVIMDENTIARAVLYLRDHPRAGMVTPRAFYPSGQRQYLCKQYPSVADLFVRGLLPHGVAKKYFSGRMARYEMRSQTEEQVNDAIQIASGCFMFCRGAALGAVNGFSKDYFLYFEDFDLSLKMVEAGWKIAYVPQASIVHYGGHASRKGITHLYHFAKSAVRFFMTHGWKLF